MKRAKPPPIKTPKLRRLNTTDPGSPIMKRELDIKLKWHIDKLLTEAKFNMELQNPITEISHFHFSQKHINVRKYFTHGS